MRQRFCLDSLQHVSHCPAAHGAHHVSSGFRDCEHDDLLSGASLDDRVQRLQPAARDRDVEKQDIRVVVLDDVHGVVVSTALSDNLEPAGFQQALSYAGPEQRMIVDDCNSYAAHSATSWCSCTSIDIVSRVPVGADVTTTVPPRLSTRWRRQARPRRSGGTVSTSKPGPRSATSIERRLFSTVCETDMPLPPAWREALPSPSCTKRKTQIFTA